MRDRPSAPLFIYLQRAVPAVLLGRLVHRLSRSRRRWLKNLLIRGFVRLYRVDTAEAALPVPDGYESFNAFFTRSLRPGARAADPDPGSVVSPADGTVQQAGLLADTELLQVKGITFSLGQLLGGDAAATATYRNGAFATIYLAPHNYHRVHMPLAGRLRSMVYVPGARWSVNATTVDAIPGIFALNERLLCHFDGPQGPFCVILVGAMNVASISTGWAGEVLPRVPRELTRWNYGEDAPADIGRGDPLGQFNLGSTVIVLAPPGAVRWQAQLLPGRTVRVGEAIGRRT